MLCTGMLMIVLDNTVVNVALPSIQRELGLSPSGLAWVVNAYLIAFGGLLLLAGRLGDLIGTKRVFLAGLVLFTFASLLCGLAGTSTMLVTARCMQGAGGAMSSAVILAMIVTMFQEPHERAKAMGVFSFTASAGGSIGLLIGGTVTQLLTWHWVFLINVPIGIVAIVIAFRAIAPQAGLGLRAGADVLGASLVTASTMLAVYTVVDIPVSGGATRTPLLGTIAGILFVAFIARQATAAKPLLPLRVFASRDVCGTNLMQLLFASGMFGFFFLGSLYLRRILNYDAVATGLAFLPITISIGAFSLGWAARLSTRYGVRATVLAGAGLAALGLAILAAPPVSTQYAAAILSAMMLIGAGMGVAFPSLMILAMSSATPSDSGLLSGLINTTGQIGGAFGLAVLATLSAARTEHLLTAGLNGSIALAGGYRFAFGAASGCLIIAGLVAATSYKPMTRRTERRRRQRMDSTRVAGRDALRQNAFRPGDGRTSSVGDGRREPRTLFPCNGVTDGGPRRPSLLWHRWL
ncbi:MAG: MFS transporter [Candidatus Elarobacter sp.]